MLEADDAEGVFAAQVDRIVGFVDDGISVHLVGPPGSGRSELLSLVADRLDDTGSTVLRLYGNQAWRHEPFGSLTAAGIAVSAMPGPRRTAGEIATEIAQRLPAGSVLLCDDADDLDQPSTGALLAAHRQRSLVAVTTSRPHHPIRSDSLMIGLSPAVRIRVPTLDFDEVHRVCQGVLDGPLDASTLARIAMKSGGLHGLVVAIADIGRRTGRLVQEGGVWTAPGAVWSEHLATIVEPFLAGADQEVWDGATALAVTGPVRLDEAEKVIGREAVDRLIAAGLVHHIDDGDIGVLGLFPPLLTDFLRREGSAFGLARGRDYLGGSLTPLVRAYDAGLDHHLDPASAVGADVAVLNQRMLQRAAEAVARQRRAWELDPRPKTALSLAVALRAAAAPPAQIEQLVHTTPLGGEDRGAAMLAAWYANWRAVDQGELEPAVAALTARASELPRFATWLRATEAHLRFLRDRVPDEDLLTDPAPEEDPAGAEMLTVVRAEMLVGTGQVERARELLDGFTPQTPVVAAGAAVCATLADVLAGDLERGTSRATDKLHSAHQFDDPGLIQAYSYVAILGLGIAGRLGDAAQVLFRTLSATTIASFRDVYHTGVLVLGAQLSLAQGRPTYGRTLAAQALAADSGTGPYPGTVPSVLAAMFPDTSDSGPGDLWRAVDDRLERGYLATAALMAVEAMERETDVERAQRIGALADSIEGRLLPVACRYVAAAAAEDLDDLSEVIGSFETIGARMYAARAAITRALVLRSVDRIGEAAEQAEAAWELSSVAGLDRAGLFTRLVEAVGLSARETEIVGLIASPMTTADVADMLQMSVRTVETHLHNVNRKLGTTGRESMVRAVTTWLRPSGER